MSARDELVKFVDEHPCCLNYEGAPDGAAMVDAFAHELAEQIREDIPSEVISSEFSRGQRYAADLIDPTTDKES